MSTTSNNDVEATAHRTMALEMPSEALAMHLIQEQQLLLAPGDYFGADHHFRIGYSVPHLANGLAVLGQAIDQFANN